MGARRHLLRVFFMALVAKRNIPSHLYILEAYAVQKTLSFGTRNAGQG